MKQNRKVNLGNSFCNFFSQGVWRNKRIVCLLVAGVGLGAAGCTTAPKNTTVIPAAPAMAWSGPVEFSADYIWSSNRPAVGYDRPAKLVRLVVRRERAVRAVGIDVFGATLYDVLIRMTPAGTIRTQYRQGAENIDGLLMEQISRLMFFHDPQSGRVHWEKSEAGPVGQPPMALTLRIESDTVELKLANAVVASQADADLEYPALP
jgi:hypothetical protein